MAIYYGQSVEVVRSCDKTYQVFICTPFPGFFEDDCRCPSPEAHNRAVDLHRENHMRAYGLLLADNFRRKEKAEAYARSVRAAAFGVLKLKKKKA